MKRETVMRRRSPPGRPAERYKLLRERLFREGIRYPVIAKLADRSVRTVQAHVDGQRHVCAVAVAIETLLR